MFRRIKSTLLPALLLALVLSLLVIEPALADTDIGTNVGNEVSKWAEGLLLGVAALVGLPALARRDIGGGLVIVLITILIGGFVWAGPTVRYVMQSVWQDAAGTHNVEVGKDCPPPVARGEC